MADMEDRPIDDGGGYSYIPCSSLTCWVTVIIYSPGKVTTRCFSRPVNLNGKITFPYSVIPGRHILILHAREFLINNADITADLVLEPILLTFPLPVLHVC